MIPSTEEKTPYVAGQYIAVGALGLALTVSLITYFFNVAKSAKKNHVITASTIFTILTLGFTVAAGNNNLEVVRDGVFYGYVNPILLICFAAASVLDNIEMFIQVSSNAEGADVDDISHLYTSLKQGAGIVILAAMENYTFDTDQRYFLIGIAAGVIALQAIVEIYGLISANISDFFTKHMSVIVRNLSTIALLVIVSVGPAGSANLVTKDYRVAILVIACVRFGYCYLAGLVRALSSGEYKVLGSMFGK